MPLLHLHTLLGNGRSPVRAAQVLFGHERIDSTLRNSHLGEAHLRERLRALQSNQLTLEVAPGRPRPQNSKSQPQPKCL